LANLLGAGLEAGDWSNGLVVYEDPGAHSFSKNVGGQGAMILLTAGAGSAAGMAGLGCEIGGLGGAALKVAGVVGGVMSTGSELGQLGEAIAKGDGWGIAEHGFLTFMNAIDLAGALTSACFAAGTPIRTPEGSKPIEELQTGDWVLAAPDNDPEGPVKPCRVLQAFENYLPIVNLRLNGRVIRTTAEHAFWVEGRGWTAAHELIAGARLRSNDDRT
jgi:hypothetical protein